MFRNLSAGAIGYGRSFFETLRPAREAGFEGIDVSAAELVDPASRDRVREALERENMRLGGWGPPVSLYAGEPEFEAGLEKLAEQAAAAASVGHVRLATWMPSWSDEMPFEENFEFHVNRVRQVAEVLAEHGCRFGLEFLGPKTIRQGHPYEFIHNIEGMLELCDAVGTGNVGLLLDAWHWYTSHGTVEDLEALRDDDVVYVHINDAPAGIAIDEQVDNVRCLPGETGVIDLVGFLQALRKIGYTGPVTPEPFSQKLREMPEEQRLVTAGETLMQVWQAAGIGDFDLEDE